MDILDIAIAKQLTGGGGGSGTDNYNDLSNLPKINGTTLSGDKSSSSLGLQSEIKSGAELASDLVDDSDSDNKFVTSEEKLEWSGKQNTIDADHKINADYVDDSTSTNKFVTASDKETWSAKQNAIDNSHKLSSDLVDDANKTNKFVTSTEKATWNAKQNAISDLETIRSGASAGATAVQPSAMQTALAGKQDSLDQTQLAAVNSGINSTKVAQIETNKTNVLYAVHKVGKNDFNFPVFAKECEVSNGTKVITDESIKLTATSADCFTIPEYNTNIKQYPKEALLPVNSGEKIVFSWVYTPHNSQTNDRVGIFGNGTYDQGKYLTAPANDGLLEYTVPGDVTYVTVRVGVATSGNSATYSEMMVSKKTAYDADPTYQMYSLPNHDLTRLEAEDRAALAEEIDAGAKNKLQYDLASLKANNSDSNWTWNGNVATHVTGVSVTVNSDMSLSISGNPTGGAFIFTLAYYNLTTQYAGMLLSGCPTGGNYQSEYALYVTTSGDSTFAYDTGDGVVINNTGINAVRILGRANAATNGKVFKPMICTLADWKVSQKYVPHQWETTDITNIYAGSSTWNYFDKDNTTCKLYRNPQTHCCIATISTITKAEFPINTSVAIGSNQILTTYRPKAVAAATMFFGNSLLILSKNAENEALALTAITSPVPSGTAIEFQVEWHYV